MADTDVWALSLITTPAATDRVPIATAPTVGGYSARGDFVYKNGPGQYLISGDGSAPSPALAFAADLDTGFYRGASGTVGAVCDGASLIFFAPGGIGVGTYTPQRLVHIQASDQSAARLRLQNTAVGGRAFDIVAGIHDASQGDFSIYDVTNGGTLFAFGVSYFRAGGDNSASCGTSGNRWSVVYSVTGAINTCDVRFKLFRIGRDTTVAEHAAALELFDAFGFYQFIESIELKGTDGARWHYGPAAQEAWAIWASHGLTDALGEDGLPPQGAVPPAFLCFDHINEEVETRPVLSETLINEQGQPLVIGTETVVTREAGNIFGVRTDQLHSLMLAALNKERLAQADQIAAQEARIAALEAA